MLQDVGMSPPYMSAMIKAPRAPTEAPMFMPLMMSRSRDVYDAHAALARRRCYGKIYIYYTDEHTRYLMIRARRRARCCRYYERRAARQEALRAVIKIEQVESSRLALERGAIARHICYCLMSAAMRYGQRCRLI